MPPAGFETAESSENLAWKLPAPIWSAILTKGGQGGLAAVGGWRARWCWLCSSAVSDQLPALAEPAEVAEYLHTTTASLAHDRYKGTGPKFIKRGNRVR